VEVGFAFKQFFDCGVDGAKIRFTAEAFDSGSFGLLLELLGGVDGDHEDRGVGMLLRELATGFEAIHFRHHEIHDGEVGRVFAPVLDSAAAVFGFADHNPVVLLFERGPKLGPNHRIIVNQKDADHADSFLSVWQKTVEKSEGSRCSFTDSLQTTGRTV
jgi:hypothetical protein